MTWCELGFMGFGTSPSFGFRSHTLRRRHLRRHPSHSPFAQTARIAMASCVVAAPPRVAALCSPSQRRLLNTNTKCGAPRTRTTAQNWTHTARASLNPHAVVARDDPTFVPAPGPALFALVGSHATGRAQQRTTLFRLAHRAQCPPTTSAARSADAKRCARALLLVPPPRLAAPHAVLH